MRYEQFRERYVEDVSMLDGLEKMWLSLVILKQIDPVDGAYWRRLEQTCEEEIVKLQAKMVRRYVL